MTNPPNKTQKRPSFTERLDARLGGWIGAFNPYDVEKLKRRTLSPVALEESSIRKRTSQITILFFTLFLIWAFVAPIDQGIYVPGSVVVMGNRKAVQHPAGGVVLEILIKEGDVVKKGDVLLRVNPLRIDAESTGQELEYINLLATESRLKAELMDWAEIKWAPELQRHFGLKDGRVVEAQSTQLRLFNTRKDDYSAQVEGLKEQLVGLKAVYQSRVSQSKTLDEEMKDTRELAKEGFVPRNQANQAERTKIDIDAGIVSTNAEIARIKLQISQVKTAFLKEVDTQLQDIQKTRDAVAIKMKAANFDAELSTVRAPSSGSVVALKVFTVGGVVSSGQVLMEIVPGDGRLAVDVRIPPELIDKVNVGMIADMRFVAFNQTTTPVIAGELKIVGADKQPGLTPQEPEFYMAQIQTTLEGQERLGDLKVQPGMPVDVVIKSGHRSLVSYILKPLSDKFATAFKQ